MQGKEINLAPNTVVFREGEPSGDLYFLVSGKLLVCTLNGSQVKAISRISPGEFIGELSFFDGQPRSSNVITLDKSRLIKIQKDQIMPHMPRWYLEVGANLTKKIRLLDHVIHQSNLRKSQAEETKPLSIDEQRHFYELLTH
jgi:CRP/FNR family cyclic AMP-dependent transcriptional regulator